ncbi:MAG: PAS domain S-box protein [Deltaproteobacteria bacterium]|nr:PAS domain S-box protein [Deltaproteobacteria bacterium]MBW2360630.1 PAS domain S-box protein [Deltaproteobacteria bacterium]
MVELLLSVFLIAIGGVVWAMRDNTNPTALWVWGWIVVGGTSILIRLGESVPWALDASHLLSPLLPGFILAGSLVYAERRSPRWLLPAALGLGALRWGMAVAGHPLAGNWVGVLIEPVAYLAAAHIVWQVARSSEASVAQRLLAPAFLANGLIDSFGAGWVLLGHDYPATAAMLWPPMAMLTLGIQVTSGGHRSRALRRALEAESAEAHRALEHSERRLSVLAEQSSDVIFETDVAGNVIYVSPSVAAVLDRSVEEILKAAPFAWTHPDDLEHGVSGHVEALDSDEQRDLLLRTLHRDGSWHWIESKMRSFEGTDGERRIVGIARDVTERQQQQELLERSHQDLERRVEERTTELVDTVEKLEREIATRRSVESQLRESRARYRAISELSSDFSFGLRLAPSGDIEIEWMSDAFTRLTGYEVAEIDAAGWRKFVNTDHWRAARRQLDPVRKGDPIECEGYITTRAGEQRYFHTRLKAGQRDAEGCRTIVGASRDITIRRRAEEERRELEQQINEVQRLESLGVLAGGIAHDFNNLLSVILGNSALALADVGDRGPAAQRLHRIRAASQHAAGLTEQMLTYSGRTPPSLKPVDLSAVIRDTSDLLKASLDKRIHLDLEANAAPAPMDGDTTQLRQIVVNLVTNAAEAIGEERGTVRVRTGTIEVAEDETFHGPCTTDPPAGKYAVLEVSDTGQGMDEATQQRIFEPFYTTRTSGRGLGLAAVLGIVQGHGGYITLESQPNLGTTFRVLFRYTEAALLPRTTPRKKAPNAARGRVLLVDDEPLVLEVGAEFLRRAGFEVVTSSGGREALERLEQADPPIDAVVLDLIMPEFDGKETLRALQASHPDVRVILTSGHDEKHTADAHSVGFLRKPYEPDELIETVAAALSG